MALRDQPYFPLYVQDYLTDEKLNSCTASTQGVFIKILCIFHKSDPYGGILLKQKDKQNLGNSLNFVSAFVSKLTKLLPFESDTISHAVIELLDEKVIQISGDFLFQKRMVQDNKTSLSRSEAGKKGGGNPCFVKTKSQTNAKNLNKQKHKQNTEYEDVNENEGVINKKRREKLNFGTLQQTFSEKWAEWVEFKKTQHNQVYKTSKTEQIAVNKLIRLSGGDYVIAEKIINESISNLWVGLFELKESKNGTSKNSSGSGHQNSGNDNLGRIPRRDLEEFVSRGRIAPLD